jgi:FMN phosphatase YigB (HAD superfamily)
MIDDSEVNINAASALGFKTIKYHSGVNIDQELHILTAE